MCLLHTMDFSLSNSDNDVDVLPAFKFYPKVISIVVSPCNMFMEKDINMKLNLRKSLTYAINLKFDTFMPLTFKKRIVNAIVFKNLFGKPFLTCGFL